MTQFVIANNVNTQLAAAAASGATTLTLASSANLPTLSAGQIMPLTLNDAATGQSYEIVYVTAISGVTLTVTRAQEGTGALNWSIGDYAYCGPTAGTVAMTTGNPNDTFQVASATTLTHAPQTGQVQRSAFNYAGLAGGTANAITATLSPAPASYTDYLIVTVRIVATNTGSLLLNVNGLGVVPVIGLGHQTLQGGECFAGGFATFAYSTNYSEAILLECTGGALQIAPATQSQHAVQLGQLENTSSPLPLATAPASLSAHAVPFSQIPVVVGSIRNAKMTVIAASSSATFTADEIMVESALGGLAYRIAVYSKTINLATTGAGGMDTGSPPSNGWVALYAILNPSTSTASILATNCTSATAPNIYGGANMPAGYTASALIGVWSTNASGQFNIGVQRDRMRSFPPVAVLTTSTSAGSYTTLNTGTIPLNAISAQFTLFMNNTANSSMSINIASDSSGSGQQSNGGLVTANDALQNNASILIATPQTLYYSSASGAGTPTYQITVSGFSF